MTQVLSARAPLLAYEPAGRWRPIRSGESRWGTAALSVAWLTVFYSFACTVGMLQATGWDRLGWLAWGFFGNWIGAGTGFLLGVIGCCQRSRGWTRAAHALWANLLVAAVPLALVFIPMWVARFC